MNRKKIFVKKLSQAKANHDQRLELIKKHAAEVQRLATGTFRVQNGKIDDFDVSLIKLLAAIVMCDVTMNEMEVQIAHFDEPDSTSEELSLL